MLRGFPAGQAHGIGLDLIEVVELAVGDKDEEAPGGGAKAVHEVADGRQQLGAGAKLLGRTKGPALGLVGGHIADDLDVALAVEQKPESGTDQRLVVGEQHADHAAR